MKKQLIAAAVAAACATPTLLHAKGIELYGILYIEAGVVEEGADATSRSYTGDENGMGRFGFRGSHQVSEALTLVGHAAWNMNMGDANDDERNNDRLTITDRDHNVGFRGSFGEVRFGSFDGAYKATGGAKYDAFASTALQARGNGGMATGAFGTTSYFHNAMQYTTPKVAGLQAVVQYSIDERPRGGAIEDYSGAYNIGLSYDFADNYQVIAAINSVETTEGRKGNQKVGARARFGLVSVMAQVEQVEVMGTAVRDLDIHFLGVRYRLGDLMLVGQYGALSDNVNSDNDQTYMALGGRYFFDRRTSSYFGTKTTSFEDENKEDLSTYMVALRHNF